MKNFASMVALVLIFNTAVAQTPNAPVVVSPVNLCWNSPASPLTAQGSNLQWISPVSSSVGEIIKSNYNWVGTDGNNKYTIIKTSVASVKIISIDCTMPSWQDENSFSLGIFDKNGKLLKTSTSSSTKTIEDGKNVTYTFNYTLGNADNYKIGLATGGANLYSEQYGAPIGSTPVIINGTSNGSRFFSNIKYTAQVPSSTAPTPLTSIAGTSNYSVTQTVNGKTSKAATVVVNVNATPAPIVTGTIDLIQGSAPTKLPVTGENLSWTSSMSSSVGGSALFLNSVWTDQGSNNKKTMFKTSVPDVLLKTVDFTIPANGGGITNLQIGLFDGQTLLATSSTITNRSGVNIAEKVTNLFNYTIKTPGEYAIGVVSGSGNIGFENSIFPLSDPTVSVSITGASGNSRLFSNIQFSFPTGGSSTGSPTPSTEYAGTSTTYYVTQTVNGCQSLPATVVVNVSGITSTTPGVGCRNNPIVLSAAASAGYILKWYSANTGGTLLKTGTSNDFTFTTPSLNSTTIYYVAAVKGSVTSGRVPIQAIVNGFTWKENWGNNNSSWSNPNNWSACNGGVPLNGSDVSIPRTPNGIILNTDVVINNLILQENATLNLNGFTLTVSSISGTGSLIGTNNSKLIINATTNSTIRFDQTSPGSTNALNSLTINRNSQTIKLDNPLVVTGLVDITGSSTLLSNGNLTLEATATSNANIASLANGGSIKGNVKVQNYFTGGDLAYRSFRTISSPVHDVSSPKGYKIAGYKSTMYVTGAGGVANGFDASPNNGATIKYYNEPKKASQNQYITAANTSEVLTQGKGIYFYFRGKKNATPGNKFVKNAKGDYEKPENVLMEYLGEINSGNISPAISYTNNAGEASSNGFNLIGNPYPSVIDWNNVTKSKLDKTIWVQKQDGNFAVYNGETGTNGGSQYILPGQGFFVKANATGASVTFTENSKAATSKPKDRLMNVKETSILTMNGESVVQENKSERLSKVGIMLTKDEFSSDETALVFRSSNSDLYDDNDISYQGEGAVSLTSVTADKKYLAINYMSQVKDLTEVILYAGFTETGTYSLSLSDLTAMDNVVITLKDNYSKKMIDLKSTKTYEFAVDKSIAASFGEKRFSVLFQAPVALPVNLLTFAASKADQGIQVKWTTETERNSSYFDVEQSTDGKAFYSLGKVNARGTSSAQSTYNFLDKNPLTGINYYRLKHVDTEAKFSYSDVISVNYSLQNIATATVTIYPNPAANEIRVNVNGSSEAVSQLNIYNIEGKKVLTSNQAYMDITSLTNGMYIVETITGDNSILLEKCKIIKN